jgi:hypothetical protein
MLGLTGGVLRVRASAWSTSSGSAARHWPAGEGYGEGHINEPTTFAEDDKLPHPLLALLPLVLVVAIINYCVMTNG